MKKILITMAMAVFAIWSAHGVSIQLIGPADFNLNAITQSEPFQLVGSKTNHSATATNFTFVSKSATSIKSFASSNMLALLENSFNTNFPAGSQIGMTASGSVLVVDHTGTNLVFNPGAVVSTSFDNDEAFTTIAETEMETENQSGFSLSGNDAETLIASVTLTYDDTAQTTGDSTQTQFQFKGLLVEKLAENLNTRVDKTTTTFEGTGDGQIRGVSTLLTGTITVKAVGRPPVS
jgi:hypothetical protein